VKAIKPEQSAIGFSALKGGSFLADDVAVFLKDTAPDSSDTSADLHRNWRVEQRFHFGGYAKINDELINFMRQFQSQYGFELDAVYTGKMFYGLLTLIEQGAFKPGSIIVAVHSGGLQGNKGFNL